MHVIAAKAQSFYEALKPEFKEYQKQILLNIKAMADEFVKMGYHLVSGGTDNHLILLDVKNSVGLTGKEAEKLLDKVHITVNKNTIPKETEKAMIASGIRIGSPAMTTRGMKEDDMVEIAHIIDLTLKGQKEEAKERVKVLCGKYPLY